MKSKIIIWMLGVMVFTGMSGCYKDVQYPGPDPNAPPENVSFSTTLVPLFVKNCSTSGCHDAIPSHKPSLTADNAFSSIKNGGYVNTIVPTNSTIYNMIKSGEMPPAGPLKSADCQKLLDWIRNGAPNN
jgi:hypothetical protein